MDDNYYCPHSSLGYMARKYMWRSFLRKAPLRSAFLRTRIMRVKYSHNSWYIKRGQATTTDSQFRFNFHLKDDDTREVELAVLCFHFPE